MHLFLLGILLGWGAAIPVGPVNLEITRRHLRYGARHGVAFGIGACSADLTYLILLSLGMISLLNDPNVLRIVGLLGAAILFWFGISAFRMPLAKMQQNGEPSSIMRNSIEGYSMTLLNPYTILFWASLSSQISLWTRGVDDSLWATGIGLMVGTVSWVLFINVVLHRIRHRISDKFMRRLNHIGGVIVMGFAVYGLIHALSF